MPSNNIYIIGWKGFIGLSFVKYLTEMNCYKKIFLYLREEDDAKSDIISERIIACHHRQFTNAILQDEKPIVFYLANSFSPIESQKYALESVTKNILPFITFLEDIKEAAKKIKLIFASSGGSIYGDTQGEACTENHTLSPKNIYAANKLAQETYLSVYHCNYGLDYKVLRIANPYGPGQFFKGGQGLIPAIMKAVNENHPLVIYGDGSAARDYIFIDDLNRCFIKIMDYQGDFRIFNVGSGIAHSILDIVECFRRNGLNVAIRHEPTNAAIVNSIKLDITRAKEHMDWSPALDIYQGISKYISWYRDAHY